MRAAPSHPLRNLVESPAPPRSSRVAVTYPANYTGTSVSEVTFSDLTSEDSVALGSWDGLSLGGEPYLTARVGRTPSASPAP